MFKKNLLSLLFVGVCFAVVAATQSGSAESTAPKAVVAQPRLLYWFKRDHDRKPEPQIIYVPQPQHSHSEHDRHHHHHPPHFPPHYWNDYYFPRSPVTPGRPDIPYGAVVIVNPQNTSNFTVSPPAPAAPAAAAPPAGGGRSGAIRSNNIVDLLKEGILSEDTEVINAADIAETEGDVIVPQQLPVTHYVSEERDEDYGEDELSLLERQAARGLSPKHLLSFLMQDNKRRRFQEAVAGIYLRNYNLNRK